MTLTNAKKWGILNTIHNCIGVVFSTRKEINLMIKSLIQLDKLVLSDLKFTLTSWVQQFSLAWGLHFPWEIIVDKKNREKKIRLEKKTMKGRKGNITK